MPRPPGPTHGYYLDVPFAGTVARHAAQPIAGIGPDSVLDGTVDHIMLDTGLSRLPPVDR